MDTRGKRGATAKLSEDELETLRQALMKQEERLRNQGAVLDKERADIEKEREVEKEQLQAERDDLQRGHEIERARLNAERRVLEQDRENLSRTREQSERANHTTYPGREQDTTHIEQTGATRDLLLSFKEELLRELSSLRRDVDQIKYQDPSYTLTDAQRQYQTFPPEDNLSEVSQMPKISFREATESVPYFDGRNLPLPQFIRACRRAKEIVPSSSERNLTKLLINKLRGQAYYAVEDEPCETIAQLIDLLNGAFGSAKTIDQYRGELSTIFIRREEHMLDYISRVKDLRSAILDAERRSRGSLPPSIANEIDALTARSFCDGLPLQYRLQISPECHTRPFEAFATAKTLAKREELDKSRYTPKLRAENYQRGLVPANPLRGPLAHSTPEHSRTPPGRYPLGRDRDYVASRSFDNAGRSTFPRDTETREIRADRNINYQRPPGNDREYPATRWCRYCKNAGHEIEQCRKREYNNSRAMQGNSTSPPRAVDESRAGRTQDQSRPVRVIETQPDEKTDAK
ncbi:hypothetical protein ALC60_11284 [Trachymyrmex zeteki]|uniref:Uncharacterized protein n=1 Tax=Mycetomoellerius zeteki TaxID=64791 RepID=A0A151WP99_9HYME|nr:hypothetical protein ALC60_11284 [Trachymyrmex zeteki]